MTAAKVLSPTALRQPRNVAPYFRFGANYIADVTKTLGIHTNDLSDRIDNAYDALEQENTDVDEDTSTLIAAVLVGDAEFFGALGEWFPPGYKLLMRGFEHPVRRKLLRIAGLYTYTLEPGFMEFYHAYPSVRRDFGAPSYSSPADVLVNDEPATHYINGLGLDAYRRSVVLGDSILHVEWYEYAAGKVGIKVPESLVERTKEESKHYFTHQSEELSEEVREFQRALFSDAEWIRDFHDTYNLRSILLKQAAAGLEDARQKLSS